VFASPSLESATCRSGLFSVYFPNVFAQVVGMGNRDNQFHRGMLCLYGLGCLISPAILVTAIVALLKAGYWVALLRILLTVFGATTPFFGGIGSGVFLVRAIRGDSGNDGYEIVYVFACGLNILVSYVIEVFGCAVTGYFDAYNY
jgi:hypothetical protein